MSDVDCGCGSGARRFWTLMEQRVCQIDSYLIDVLYFLMMTPGPGTVSPTAETEKDPEVGAERKIRKACTFLVGRAEQHWFWNLHA